MGDRGGWLAKICVQFVHKFSCVLSRAGQLSLAWVRGQPLGDRGGWLAKICVQFVHKFSCVLSRAGQLSLAWVRGQPLGDRGGWLGNCRMLRFSKMARTGSTSSGSKNNSQKCRPIASAAEWPDVCWQARLKRTIRPSGSRTITKAPAVSSTAETKLRSSTRASSTSLRSVMSRATQITVSATIGEMLAANHTNLSPICRLYSALTVWLLCNACSM